MNQNERDKALLKAVIDQPAEVISLMIRQGADVNARHKDGSTALHLAAEHNPDALRVLLRSGADVNLVDNEKTTPLMVASIHNQKKAASMLLQHMTPQQTNQSDIYGRDALFYAFESSRPVGMLTLLLDGGADPVAHHQDRWGDRSNGYIRAVGLMNGEAIELFRAYCPPPALENITRDRLLDRSNTLLEHPHGWHQFDTIASTLDVLGTPLSKGDLLSPFYHGSLREARCYLARAAQCARFGVAMDYLNTRGEYLTPEDLLTADGKPNPLLETIIERESLQEVFRSENWESQHSSALRKLWQALPENARKQVGNYRALLTMADSRLEYANGR